MCSKYFAFINFQIPLYFLPIFSLYFPIPWYQNYLINMVLVPQELVRAALCRRCLTALGHYFAYFYFLLFLLFSSFHAAVAKP
jgi:hypothetical protein